MKQLQTTFASAVAGILMLSGNVFAQGFERPYIMRPPADIGYPQPHAHTYYDRGVITREELPPPTVIAPEIDQQVATPDKCENLRDRFCIPKPEIVDDPHKAAEGTITIIDTATEKHLYLSLGGSLLSLGTPKAVRYKVATAKAQEKMPRGEYFLSTQRGGERQPDGSIIYGLATDPRWCPTDNIRLQRGMPKGYCMPGTDKDNPFGGVAFYLSYLDEKGEEVRTVFRIHGTTEPKKIGQNVSSGCVRMYTPDAKNLFRRVIDMIKRGVKIAIVVPQGPTRQEYAENQRRITAQIRERYEPRDPYFVPYDNRRRQPNFFEQLFRF